MSRIEENKRTVLTFLEAFYNKDLDLYFSMMSEDLEYKVMGNSVLSGQYTKSQLMDIAREFTIIFPDGLKMRPVGITAEGDRVSLEAVGEGRTTSGKDYNNVYHIAFVVRDGKVHEFREYVCTKLLDQVFAPAP